MECRNGTRMLKDRKWNVRVVDVADLAGGSAAEADPLSRSFDLHRIDIDQLSLIHSADHKGAAQD